MDVAPPADREFGDKRGEAVSDAGGDDEEEEERDSVTLYCRLAEVWEEGVGWTGEK